MIGSGKSEDNLGSDCLGGAGKGEGYTDKGMRELFVQSHILYLEKLLDCRDFCILKFGAFHCIYILPKGEKKT